MCLHDLNFWMYVRDAWWIWCSTRSGVPRINQTYSSYPAGTDILFDATEVSYKSHLLHLHCPSGLYCQLGFRVCHRRSCTIWSTNFFFARGGFEIKTTEDALVGVRGFEDRFTEGWHWKNPPLSEDLRLLVFLTSQTSEFIYQQSSYWFNANQI